MEEKKPEDKVEIETPKENKWEAVDELCPTCKAVIKPARGWNRQNMKRLLRAKPKGLEWLVIFLIIMFVFGMLVYKQDTQVCREYVSNFSYYCSLANKVIFTNYTKPNINLTNISIAIK